MDYCFENRYTGNRKMLVEFARKYAVGPKPWTWILFAPFSAIMLLALYLGVDAEVKQRTVYFFAVLILLQLMPHYYAWAVIRQDKKKNNGKICESVIRFGDKIVVSEPKMELTLEYDTIVRVVHLKHSYVLMNSRRTGVMLDVSGFTKGTFEEFKQFLREKRPDLKIPE